MNGSDLLLDAFGRVRELVASTLDGLDAETLSARLDPQANSIGWLVWHLTRVQDDHVAEVAGREQVYVAGGWWDRLGRPFGSADHGYGQTSEQVGSLQLPSPGLLVGYHDAVHSATADFLRTLSPADFDRVVDTRWDPPVTLGARLISVVSDDLQHIGQAAYARGCLSRR